MPLMPKRVKYRKQSKGNRGGWATSGAELAYGEFGLKATTRGFLTATQIEACRVAINREMKRKGKLWIRMFPDKPVTRKPIEVRMGGGKGNPEFWVAVVLPGKVLFEIGGVSEEVARECLRLAATKIGIHTKHEVHHACRSEDLMKTNELKELGADELAAKIKEVRKELFELKLKQASKVDVEKPVRMRLLRREVARMLTVQAAAKKEAK